jgi:hypothetical protein
MLGMRPMLNQIRRVKMVMKSWKRQGEPSSFQYILLLLMA